MVLSWSAQPGPARTHPRYRDHPIGILLIGEGLAKSSECGDHLWENGRLQVHRKPRRRVSTLKTSSTLLTGKNHVWCFDFVFGS